MTESEALSVLRELVELNDYEPEMPFSYLMSGDRPRKFAKLWARARAVVAGAPAVQDVETVTEWAVWFDKPDPNDLGADVRHEATLEKARRVAVEDPDDLAVGVCRRTMTHTRSRWVPVDTPAPTSGRATDVDQAGCAGCGGGNTTYQSFSGGREYYCADCDDTFPYAEGEGPRRVQMLRNGQFDELRAEMREELARRDTPDGGEQHG